MGNAVQSQTARRVTKGVRRNPGNAVQTARRVRKDVRSRPGNAVQTARRARKDARSRPGNAVQTARTVRKDARSRPGNAVQTARRVRMDVRSCSHPGNAVPKKNQNAIRVRCWLLVDALNANAVQSARMVLVWWVLTADAYKSKTLL